MTTMLILTEAQAEAVRGPTSSFSALDPRPLTDGSFALPVAVLSDPAHAASQDALDGLPQRSVAAEEWAVEPGT